MGVLTTLLKLLKPGENDYYNQQTEQADNWDKVDNYAVLTNTDKNGVWGGEFGGYIQDPIPKELNKRYVDNINGKAFICIKAGDSSVVSNTTEYFTPCNVVDNLDKLQNLSSFICCKHKITDVWTNTSKSVLPLKLVKADNISLSNNSVTFNETGIYEISFSLNTMGSVGQFIEIDITKNGTPVFTINSDTGQTLVSEARTFSINTVLEINRNDSIQFRLSMIHSRVIPNELNLVIRRRIV